MTTVLLAGCQANWMSLNGLQSPPKNNPAKLPPGSASATQPKPVNAAASSPADDPSAQLTQEIQQYINNLPMDDLQAKLSHHEGRGAPQASDAAPAPALTTDDPAGTSAASASPAMASAAAPAAAANRHVPLPPEIILPSGDADEKAVKLPRPSAPMSPAQPGNTQIVNIDISPGAIASLSNEPASPRMIQPKTNQPVAAKPSPSDDLKHLIEQLRKEASDRPDSVGAALRLRTAEWLLTGNSSPEEWPLQDADKRRLAQSVWQVLQLVSKLEASPQGAPSDEFQKAIESLTQTLQQVQPLQIPTALLCRSVSSFGCAEAMPEPWQFAAGRTSMVVLYCELAGFRSEPAPAKPNWYHTLLSQRLAILTSSGKELWNFEDQPVEDFCSRPRRDFFITKLLKIPAELPAGDYVLKVTIRDKLANRVTETNILFGITLAASPDAR